MQWSLIIYGILGWYGSKAIRYLTSSPWQKPLYEFVGKNDDRVLHLWISHINESLWGVDSLNLDYSYNSDNVTDYDRAISALTTLNSTFHTAEPHELMITYLNVSHFGGLTREQAADDQYLCNALIGRMADFVPECKGRVVYVDKSKKIFACDLGFEPMEGCKGFGDGKDRVYLCDDGFEPDIGCRVVGKVSPRPGLTNEQWEEMEQ